MLGDLAPIVLFVYNRPWHTLQTLEALSRNPLAEKSVLYVFADGQKNTATEEDIIQIEEIKKVVSSKKWCKEVHIIKSIENRGLANSIKNGVTEIINKHGKVIVLEDDIVVGKFFLNYMNDALELYKDHKKVMHISSYLPPENKKIKLKETFLLQYMSCWGWATWSDRWDLFIDDINYLYHTLQDKNMNYAGFSDSDMFNQIELNYQGIMNTWAVKWYATIFLNNGLCLYPCKTLTSNIGMDGSGMNSGIDPLIYDTVASDLHIEVSLIHPIEESKKGKKYLISCYKKINKQRGYETTFLIRFRKKYPSLVNFIFRFYNTITRKYK